MYCFHISFLQNFLLFIFLTLNYTCSSAIDYDSKSVTEIKIVNENDNQGPIISSNSTGVFSFNVDGYISNKKINVYYHIPNGDMKSMPILMSFHGGSRNANDYRDYWISLADDSNFMVFAPEFGSLDFSSGDMYNLANIFDDGDNPTIETLNQKEEWTFSIIDPLFEYIKNEVSGNQESYNGWGHSAGSQFLHRFILFMPDSKLNVAVCSNAGWYTVPESGIDFPYGLNKSELSSSTLKLAFSKNLYVHLADLDTNPNASSLRHNETVDNQQGLNRRARGRYFYKASKAIANQKEIDYNWIKTEEVLNVGHSAKEMAVDALQYLYPNN